MAISFRKRYKDQLPRRQSVTFERILTICGGLASIVALWLVFYPPTEWLQQVKPLLLTTSIVAFPAVALSLIGHRLIAKPHRYAQAVYYTHYVDHLVRDFVSDALADKHVDLQVALDDVADAVAACFSIITAKRCRCVIKDVTPQQSIATVARDSVSKTGRKSDGQNHPIDGNSDFADLWYGRNGCLRYFFCNNLIWLFKSHQYTNTSFQYYGKPEVKSILGFSWVANWRLPYRSAIIWPIRHIPNYDYWPPMPDAVVPTTDVPITWGFLCVDCNSRYIFDERYAPELGAGFADALHTLLTAAAHRERRIAADSIRTLLS